MPSQQSRRRGAGHGAHVLLGEDRGQAGEGRDGQKGLFPEQELRLTLRENLQWPPVQQPRRISGRVTMLVLHMSPGRETDRCQGIPSRRALRPRVASVAPEGQEGEQRAQDVLARGDSRHRFHMQRMQGEQRGHDGAAPSGTREGLQGQEQHDRAGGGVEQKVAEVESAGRAAMDRGVHQVGEPDQRLPESGLEGGEGPLDAVWAEPPQHPRVAGDVTVVVVVEEFKVRTGQYHRQHHGGQDKSDTPIQAGSDSRAEEVGGGSVIDTACGSTKGSQNVKSNETKNTARAGKSRLRFCFYISRFCLLLSPMIARVSLEIALRKEFDPVLPPASSARWTWAAACRCRSARAR